ncbi:glycosyltransferase family 2 protein [Asticcacaulis tiandongensis]|uniref:glycosyltransferase family 2 protein n=1 Tax=Asticcacaulis tiandongensis TaxID=2565365 RepID=UPI00112BAE2E|nr:glycosyltransferase family A protein [Asticcacaulis tiandongensis]
MSNPRISCIITAYNEGALASLSIRSILNQSFTDFELLIVDDGASEDTRATLQSFNDARIVHIRQANDGLSSARNRALGLARGDYICFLDADDSRPVWAFEEMIKTAERTQADCVFCPGLLSEVRHHITPFYDQTIFEQLSVIGPVDATTDAQTFLKGVALAAAIEPQSANKFLKRSFVEKYRLRFPAGLFFEDIVFHNSIVINMDSFAITEAPCFTYFRRYGRPQITGGSSTTRFDSISSAANLLELFSHSRYFQETQIRAIVVASTFKLLEWCNKSVAHNYKWSFRQSLTAMIQGINPRYLSELKAPYASDVYAIAPWVEPSLKYAQGLKPS